MTMTGSKPLQIFIISLAHSTDRRAMMQKELEKVGIALQITEELLPYRLFIQGKRAIFKLYYQPPRI